MGFVPPGRSCGCSGKLKSVASHTCFYLTSEGGRKDHPLGNVNDTLPPALGIKDHCRGLCWRSTALVAGRPLPLLTSIAGGICTLSPEAVQVLLPYPEQRLLILLDVFETVPAHFDGSVSDPLLCQVPCMNQVIQARPDLLNETKCSHC